MSNRKIRAVCRTAIFAALYFLLTMISIRAGNLRITFASLPVVVSALLFGPVESLTVALLGEFLNQMLSYGFTATTALWIFPPALRGLVIGLMAVRCLNSARPLEERPVLYYAVCMTAATITTIFNTLVMTADAQIYHYFTWTLAFGDLAVRLLTGLVTAAAVSTIALPLVRLLRRRPAILKN